MDNWNNADGYGFWCGKKCVEQKKAAGIPPLGARKTTKAAQAAADQTMAEAALLKAGAEDSGWSPMATAGVVVASLLGIALMVVVIKKTKK